MMADKTKVTVVNTSPKPMFRGGYLFPPQTEKTVLVSVQKMAEIKACAVLQIFDPGLRCDQPDCAFVGRNEASLNYHKKKAHGTPTIRRRRKEADQSNADNLGAELL